MTVRAAFLLLALLLLPLPAAAQDKAPAAQEKTAPQDKPPAQNTAAELEAAGVDAKNYQQPVCIVTGIVKQVQTIEKSPLRDGTPSTLTMTEVRLVLDVENRAPQDGPDASACPLPPGHGMTYKLCSPVKPKVGDRIVGTEGMATGSDAALGCLFDVATAAPSQKPGK